MPSIRKRIGYLPSQHIQEIITKIAKREKLSQSKVVGILVEEALISRGVFGLKNKHDSMLQESCINGNQIDSSFEKYNDLDELISDKGITYNTKKYKFTSNESLAESTDANNEELFEQFKQFILFQKMIQGK